MTAIALIATPAPTHEFKFEYCVYQEFWTGEYPYSSSCQAQVLGLDGKVVKKFCFSTCINKRGETDADYCRRWAKNYIPPNATVDDVLAMWTQRGKSVAELMATLKEAIKAQETCIASLRRPLFLYKGKALRKEWRKIHEDKKESKRFLAYQGHLLQMFMTNGINYLPKEIP